MAMIATMATAPAKPFSWGLISTGCPRWFWPARPRPRNSQRRSRQLPARLILGLRTDHRDHTHLGRINQHDLIIDLGELVQLGFRIVGENVVRQGVELNHRRHLSPDMGGKAAGRDLGRVLVHFLVNRAALRGRQCKLWRDAALAYLLFNTAGLRGGTPESGDEDGGS